MNKAITTVRQIDPQTMDERIAVSELSNLLSSEFSVFELPQDEPEVTSAEWCVAEAFLDSTSGQNASFPSDSDVTTAANHYATAFSLPDERAVLVVPIGHVDAARRFAVASVRNVSAAVALHNASYAMRKAATEVQGAANLRTVRESYLKELAQSYEEMAWLRELSARLEHCDVSNTTQEVGGTVIPSLLDLCKAQSAVLVTQSQESEIPRRPRNVLHWYGEVMISDLECCQLIAQYAPDEVGQTVIRNQSFGQTRNAHSIGSISSFVLTPIRTGQQHFGWIVIFNRLRPDTEPFILGADEFGTVEAGLVGAAACVLASHRRNAELFQERELLTLGVVQSLVRTLEARDEYTCGHSDRVAEITRMLARELGVSKCECARIYRSGLLHDIGKVGVPDEVLGKTGRLTDEEFQMIQQHPVIGMRILKDLRSFEDMLPAVMHHHERVDGKGYPAGLKGDDIPFTARIMAVADGFDAMTSNRPYRSGMPFEKAENILRENAGSQWDTAVVDAYFRIQDQIRLFVTNHRQANIMSGLESEANVLMGRQVADSTSPPADDGGL